MLYFTWWYLSSDSAEHKVNDSMEKNKTKQKKQEKAAVPLVQVELKQVSHNEMR